MRLVPPWWGPGRSSRPRRRRCSFGFRPQRSAHDALQVVIDEAWRGRVWVVETDIANCFEAIPSEKLMQAVEERVCDQSVLKLLRAMLRAGVMVDGQVVTPQAGTPQGGQSCCKFLT
jgi:retron-type reverse transcriptase